MNRDFTLISKDCTGAKLLHELGLRFNTPTVNLNFTDPDFVKFCRHLKFYLSEPLIEDKDANMDYPVGILGSGEKMIRINLMHYDSFEQAKAKWEERASRIRWDNMYFIMADGEFCNHEVAMDFDSLPYEHKVLLTYRDMEGVRSAVKFESIRMLTCGIGPLELFKYKSIFSLRRPIDDWDYVSFFNS